MNNPKLTPPTGTNLPAPMRLGELLNLSHEPIHWLIDNLLIRGGCSLLASKPKVGKTTFVRSMAFLAVAQGKEFIGRDSQKGSVLLILLEDKKSEIARHFKSMGADGEEEIFVLCDAPPRLIQIKEIIERERIGLVIVDTLVLGVTGLFDINDYLGTSRALAPYVQLARTTDCHISFTHHLGKVDRNGGDQILGSTALFAAVDAVLLLERGKTSRTFKTIMRYGTETELTEIKMDESNKIVLGKTIATSIDNRILDYLIATAVDVTEKDIEFNVSGRTSEKRKSLRDLVAIGKVNKCGKGTRSDPFQYSTPT